MNVLLLEPGELDDRGRAQVVAPDRARVIDRRLTHVRTVHRAGVGDTLRVGVIGGRLGRATIVRLDAGGLELDVRLEHDPPAPLPLALVLALPRPKVVRRVLQGIAALGVKRVVLVGAWRVERSYWESPRLDAAAIRDDLVLGLEQSGDTVLPEVALRRRFRPFVEDELPALAAKTRKLVAHPEADAGCPRAVAAPITLAIGPDGGFNAFEVELLATAGFEPVSLGPRVLRVEHAVPALVGRLL
jgi:RsmE family RNA methyltransferase